MSDRHNSEIKEQDKMSEEREQTISKKESRNF